MWLIFFFVCRYNSEHGIKSTSAEYPDNSNFFFQQKVLTIFSLFVSFKFVWHHLNYISLLIKFTGCSFKKLDILSKGLIPSLKFYIIYWVVVIIHDIESFKVYNVFYSLWKVSVESLHKNWKTFCVVSISTWM